MGLIPCMACQQPRQSDGTVEHTKYCEVARLERELAEAKHHVEVWAQKLNEQIDSTRAERARAEKAEARAPSFAPDEYRCTINGKRWCPEAELKSLEKQRDEAMREAIRSMEAHEKIGAENARLRERIALLAARAEKAEAERDGVRGERNRTAAYVLGGQVEGAPTTEYNWIQRARELVRIEAEAREHCKARERRNVEASKENRDLRARAEKAEAERDEAIAAANKREADWIERIVRAIRGKSDPWDRSTKLEDVRKEAERMAAELARLRDVVRKLTDRSRVRPGSDWHENMGAVLWTDVPIEEPPYCGTPLDQDFPWRSTPVAKLFFVQLPPVFTGEFKAAEAALGEEGT